MQLPRLDAVCRETTFASRSVDSQARKDVILPLSEPTRGNNDELLPDIPITRGTMIFIGIVGFNLNKALGCSRVKARTLAVITSQCRDRRPYTQRLFQPDDLHGWRKSMHWL